MRSLVIALPASLLFIASAHGQVLTEHAAAAAGAAIGAGAGKSLSTSMTKIFGETDKETAKAAKPDTKKQAKPVTNPTPDALATAKSKPSAVAGSAPTLDPLPPSASHPSAQHSRRKPAPQDETAASLVPAVAANPIPAAPPVAEPVVKVPTVQDLANIKVGATESDLIAALGPPSSHIIIPDDDGHLREICQYWANGRVLGTIRLDNGQVASVEPRPEN